MSVNDNNHHNRLILNYHDAVLYESDLQLLQSPTAWLNDACIHFGMTRLAQQYTCSNDNANDNTSACSLVFMDPSVVTYFMHQCVEQDEIQEFVDSHYARLLLTSPTRPSLTFVPINNGHCVAASTSTTTPWHEHSGTHWSLLVMAILCAAVSSRSNDTNATSSSSSSSKEESSTTTPTTTISFSHFDSVQGSNAPTALAVARKFHQALLQQQQQQHSQSLSTPAVVECQTPQQVNGYDCGLHVLAATDVLAKQQHMDVMAARNNVNYSNFDVLTKGSLESALQEVEFHTNHNNNNNMSMMAQLRKTLANEATQLARDYDSRAPSAVT